MPQQPRPIDYDTLAAQHGGTPVEVDYDAIAEAVRAPEPLPTAAETAPMPWQALKDTLATQSEFGQGILKGAANTAIGAGELAYRYVPGVAPLTNALVGAPNFPAARQAVQPTTSAEQLGFTGEQIGEFFVPLGVAGKAAKAAEVARATGLTLAQTGSPTSALVSGGITAIVPGAGAAGRARGALERSAEKSVAGALGATKEWAKAEAASLAPQMLARGVKGSRAEMLAQARTMTVQAGAHIASEIQRAAAAGTTIGGAGIAQVLDDAVQGLTITTAGGRTLPIAGTEPVIRQLGKLRTFVETLGPDIPIDQAAKIKTAWDRIVSKAGLYGPKAQASATDSAAAWSIREAATAFRNLLNTANPTLADLNQEYAFWKGLRGVLTETERRTQAQGAGLISGVTGGAGIVGGLISGENVEDKLQNALVYGVAGRQLVRVLQSPAWQTRVSAPLKHALAEALTSGSVPRVTSALQRITATLPAQLHSAPSVP
jgi:hypothetical protein